LWAYMKFLWKPGYSFSPFTEYEMIPSGIQTSLFDLFWYVLMMALENELGGALESVQIFSLVKLLKIDIFGILK